MRAYTILGIDYTHADAMTAPDYEVVGISSSKKHAIEACEHWLNANSAAINNKIVWTQNDKHTGSAKKGEVTASYQMHFVNQLEAQEA